LSEAAMNFKNAAKDVERVRAEPADYIKHLIDVRPEQWAEWLSFGAAIRRQAKKEVAKEQRAAAAQRKANAVRNLRNLKTKADFTNDHMGSQ